MRFTTRLLHDSFGPDKATGAVTQPLYQSTAFYQETAEDMEKIFAGRKPGFVYTRVGNPTIASFEMRIRSLEGGVGAVACASGMAAVSQAVLNVSNIGDARTLVVHPASTIFAHASEAEKDYAGVTSDLVRISVGLEDAEDLLADFGQALAKLAES